MAAEETESRTQQTTMALKEDLSRATCAICGVPIGIVAEMPRQVCFVCTREVTDENGRTLAFWGISWDNTPMITYLDTGEPREGDECFCKKIRCRAFASKYGGYCFQAQPEPPGK